MEPATRQVTWSAELFRVFGLDPASPVTPGTYLEHVHLDDRDVLAVRIDALLADRVPFELDHRIVRADGEERVVQARIACVPGAQGRPRSSARPRT